MGLESISHKWVTFMQVEINSRPQFSSISNNNRTRLRKQLQAASNSLQHTHTPYTIFTCSTQSYVVGRSSWRNRLLESQKEEFSSPKKKGRRQSKKDFPGISCPVTYYGRLLWPLWKKGRRNKQKMGCSSSSPGGVVHQPPQVPGQNGRVQMMPVNGVTVRI